MATKTKKNYSSEQLKMRKIRKQLDKNNTKATVLFVLALLIFLPICVYVLFMNIALFAEVDTSAVEDQTGLGEAIFVIFALINLVATGAFIMPFFAALSFRRGKEDRKRKFPIVLAVLSAIVAAVVFAIKGVADFGQWLLYVAIFLGFGVVSIGLMALAHIAGLFEMKEAKWRRREESKLHGGVWFVYIMSIFGMLLASELSLYFPEYGLLAYPAALLICLIAIGIAACKRAPFAKKEKLLKKQYESVEFGAPVVMDEDDDEDEFYFMY